MTPPVLVTAPTGPVVSLSDMKLHVRVDHDEDDGLITSLEEAAVAHLDGWRGTLGRAILPQVWRQEFDNGDALRLLLPDVTEVDVTAFNAEGAEVAVEAVLRQSFRGPYLEVDGGYSRLTCEYTCAMPATQLPAVIAAIKLLVGHWYANRETVVVGTSSSNLPLAVDALITAMRWREC